MSVSERVRAATGRWNGTNRLIFPGAPPRDVASTAVVALVAQGQFSTLSYTWSFDGQSQDGLLLIGEAQDRQSTTVVWVDSWHMGDKAMLCAGPIATDGPLVVRGSYQVEGHPDWSWRIDLWFAAEALRIVMYNVSPEGEESLAVEADYSR
jgi:hypothetical protein